MALAAPEQFLSDPDAMQAFTDAQAAFGEQNFEEAARLLEKAYLIEPKADLLFPWAQAEKNLGNCDIAVDLYQQFLDSNPEGQFADAARENLDSCQEEIDAAAAAVVPDPVDEPVEEDPLFEDPEPEKPKEPVKQNDDDPKARKWYADPVGGVLFGVGLVGVGVGAGILGAASSAANGAPDVATNDDYVAERDRATKLRNGGAIALSIGAALLVGAVIRYAVVARKIKKNKKTAAFRFDGVSVSGRF